MEGNPGPTGPSGRVGIQGVTGSQGTKGFLGAAGPVGLTGTAGLQGVRGTPGVSPVPLRVQVFSTTATTNTTGLSLSIINKVSTGSPELSVAGTICSSTIISGLSINSSTGTFTIPAGAYYIEGACSFYDSVLSTTAASLNLYTDETKILSGTIILSATEDDGGHGTSYLSGSYSTKSSVTATLRCDVTRDYGGSSVDIPAVSTALSEVAPTVFVTIIQV
jgi:hypothetical protein